MEKTINANSFSEATADLKAMAQEKLEALVAGQYAPKAYAFA